MSAAVAGQRKDDVHPILNEDGKYICLTDGTLLPSTPEETVRQGFIAVLINEYGYPANRIRREVPIYHGSSEIRDRAGKPVRADIVVYASSTAAARRDQGQIKFVVECKKPDAKSGYEQLVSYIFSTNAPGGVWTNGVDGDESDTKFYRVDRELAQLLPVTELPRVDEKWGSINRRKKTDLEKPHDVRRLFRLCNSKLYGRGMENFDYDITMDMVRILLAKIEDESAPGDYPAFYISQDEYENPEGREAAAQRVRSLFEAFAERHREVFPEGERIEVPDSAIVEAVTVLQPWSLVVGYQDADEWDVMGAAYEQYTHQNLKRQRGQFFTNRLIVSAMVQMADPQVGEKVLDPAGGSGGFVTSAFRYMRQSILATTAPGSPQRERQLDQAKNDIFLSEISPRLVKLAKTAMLLNGDGHAGMTKANSLGPYEKLDPWIQSRCARGVPKVILSNPPFAGQGESRIADPQILADYETAYRTVVSKATGELVQELMQQQSPELLFFERCLDWLAEGGRMGIVLPKAFLDTAQAHRAREMLFERAYLDGVVTLHKDSFQPDTGVRTCMVFLTKKTERQRQLPEGDYDIFMAVSQKVGQTSEGEPIFVVGDDGRPTAEIDHDLDEIVHDFKALRSGSLVASQFRYAVKRSDIDNRLNINPQFYSPHLNESIATVRRFDELDGWSVTTLGQLEKGIAVFKGPRLKTENVIVSDLSSGTDVVGYFTPSAMLQDKRDSAKLIDLAKATNKQLRDFEIVTVREGDLLLTRSGSIGRLAYVSSVMEGQIVSDDMIRVRVPSEEIRAYVAAFLLSENAMAQMLMNEYGSVQQHLEPGHVRDLLIPVPRNWLDAAKLIASGKEFIESKEASDRAMQALRTRGFDRGMTELLG
ncbi:Type I restriction enzyme R protein N terminus (HSDR_N) [Schaalia meyeri]|uniref:N-6 DNA methylase n=1 Tax=Schaalia meyeri TaxID=52773 RepID=UPI000893A87F|nr:N-6 DNA methylase [Schaalia meyeri]SDS04679.1 Type I restriction enzyme R protein N terminus (HSDR_N) [Schaalia meyeri]